MLNLCRCVIVVAAVIGAASSAAAQDLTLTMANGRVTLVAHDVPLQRILAEWARVGKTRIVNGEKLFGPPMTIELVDYPEGRALDLLLRQAAGYMAAPRPAGEAGGSLYDRILILPTSRPPATTSASAPPPYNRNLMPQPMPVPVDDQDEPIDQGPVPPPGMVPQGVPMPGVQPFPTGANQQQPVLTAPRPGQLPAPAPTPGMNPYVPPGTNPYAPPGTRPQIPPTRPPGGGQ